MVPISLVILDILLGLSFLAGDKYFHSRNPRTTYPELRQVEGKNWNYDQISSFFTTLARGKGAEYSFKLLKLAKLPPTTDVHLIGHAVGDVLYKQMGAKGIQVCTEELRNACSHSIVTGILLDKGEAGIDSIISACRQAPGGKAAYDICFHGMGHGVLAYNGYDLEKDIAFCQRTLGKMSGREVPECVGGGIMELVGGGGHDHDKWLVQNKKYLGGSDALYPCNSDLIPDSSKGMCYVYITPQLTSHFNARLGSATYDDLKQAFGLCGSIPNSDFSNKEVCFSGFGKEFVARAQFNDIRRIDQMTDSQLYSIYQRCSIASSHFGVSACLESSVGSISWGGTNDWRTLTRFCSVIDDPYYQAECFKSSIDNMNTWVSSLSIRQDFCRLLPARYNLDCFGRLVRPLS